jgi:hypothetical protein
VVTQLIQLQLEQVEQVEHLLHQQQVVELEDQTQYFQQLQVQVVEEVKIGLVHQEDL